MSSEIGELSEECGEITVKWTVKDICPFPKTNESFRSSYFWVSGSRWYMKIYPCGMKGFGKYISLRLKIADKCETPKSVEFSFGMKKSNQTVEYVYHSSFLFHEQSLSVAAISFLKRADLVRRKEELAPSGHLTVMCTMRVNGSTNSTSGLQTLSENFKDIFLSKEGYDVTLNVQQEKIPAHKTILAARSPVFSAMFEVDMKEKNTGVVNIEFFNPGPFKEFVMYLYSGKLEDPSENVFELCKIANMYDVRPLEKACETFITFNLSLENVFDAVILAEQFQYTYLKKVITKFFNDNFDEIVSSCKWELFFKENFSLANNLLKDMAKLKK